MAEFGSELGKEDLHKKIKYSEAEVNNDMILGLILSLNCIRDVKMMLSIYRQGFDRSVWSFRCAVVKFITQCRSVGCLRSNHGNTFHQIKFTDSASLPYGRISKSDNRLSPSFWWKTLLSNFFVALMSHSSPVTRHILPSNTCILKRF